MLSIDPLGADPSYRPKLLLVDDDEVNLMLTAVALRERGFDVVEAGSGDRALQLLTERPTDVVVLDAMMPGLRRLRDLPRAARDAGPRARAGADAHRPGRRRVDHARLSRPAPPTSSSSRTQWSLLAGRLRYLLRASRTRMELERSKSKLARAQDLARMGSFDWRRASDDQAGNFMLSPEGAARVRPAAARHAVDAPAAAHGARGRAPRHDAHAARRAAHGHRAGHRRAGDGGRRPPAHRARRGRARVQRHRATASATPASCRT